jgi:hypothetical protein
MYLLQAKGPFLVLFFRNGTACLLRQERQRRLLPASIRRRSTLLGNLQYVKD